MNGLGLHAKLEQPIYNNVGLKIEKLDSLSSEGKVDL